MLRPDIIVRTFSHRFSNSYAITISGVSLTEGDRIIDTYSSSHNVTSSSTGSEGVCMVVSNSSDMYEIAGSLASTSCLTFDHMNDN